MPIGIEPILSHIPGWLLVLFRLTGVFIFSPVFGSNAVPGRVKVFFAVGLSVCIYPMLLTPGSTAELLAVRAQAAGVPMWSLVGVITSELMVGLLIGFGASLPMLGMQLGGRVIDQQMGLGLAGIFNPEVGEQTGIVSEVYFLLALAVFVILGGHRAIVGVLVGSFEGVPLGAFTFDIRVVDLMIGLMTTVTELALRVAAPLICLMFLQTVAMGFIAKTVPQMNILSVGFVLRICLGAVVLIGAFTAASGAYGELVIETMGQLSRFFAK